MWEPSQTVRKTVTLATSFLRVLQVPQRLEGNSRGGGRQTPPSREGHGDCRENGTLHTWKGSALWCTKKTSKQARAMWKWKERWRVVSFPASLPPGLRHPSRGRVPLRTLPLGRGKHLQGSSLRVTPFGRWRHWWWVWLPGRHVACLWQTWSLSLGVWLLGQCSLPQPRGLKISVFWKVPSLVTIKKSTDFEVKLTYSPSCWT